MALDPGALKAGACELTGLSDFGDAPFEQSLAILCRSLREEARLSEEGLRTAEALLTGHLAERLRLENFLASHPAILEQEVAPALFLVGMPRSGTTALAQLLSEDPALRSIPRWESKRLTPPERGSHTLDDERVAQSRAEFANAFAKMPWRQRILPNNYDDPAEHGQLLALTFLNLQWPTLFRVPSWTAWALEQDLTPGYLYMARVLKVLQWARPARCWSLKLPPDLFALEAMVRVFPNSKFIWVHRNPVESISSICSLCAQVREMQHGATVDPLEIGPEQLEFQARGVDRGLAAREGLGESRFTDIWQEDLGRDTVATIRDLYGKLGMELTPEYRVNLATRMRTKRRGRFGQHSHELAAYGLGQTDVEVRLANYLARFH